MPGQDSPLDKLPSDRQLCQLSQIFNAHHRLGVDDHFAINEFLKELIAHRRALDASQQASAPFLDVFGKMARHAHLTDGVQLLYYRASPESNELYIRLLHIPPGVKVPYAEIGDRITLEGKRLLILDRQSLDSSREQSRLIRVRTRDD